MLEVIRDMAASSIGQRLSVKDITGWFADRNGEEYGRRIASKYIGSVIRRRLRRKTQKSLGVYVIPPSELPRLEALCERYGIARENPGEDQKCKGRQTPENRFGSLAESRIEGR